VNHTHPDAPPRLRSLPAPDAERDVDLVGLRRDDLDRDERRRLVATLYSKDGASERESALAVAFQVSQLPGPPSDLHAGHVLELVAARRRTRSRSVRLAIGGLVLGILALFSLAAAPWLLSLLA
jgi:hypothetical protein